MTSPSVLLLNGSPRLSGHSMALAHAVLAPVAGDVTTVSLYQFEITPCIACDRCATEPACPLRDDMPSLLRLLEDADLLLIASPLHFVSLTAPLVAFYSRLQPLWHAKRRGEKPLPPRLLAGGLAATGGASYRNMFEPARAVTAAAFNSIGLPFAGMAVAADTDRVAIGDNAEALDSARRLGEKLAGIVAACN